MAAQMPSFLETTIWRCTHTAGFGPFFCLDRLTTLNFVTFMLARRKGALFFFMLCICASDTYIYREQMARENTGQ